MTLQRFLLLASLICFFSSSYAQIEVTIRDNTETDELVFVSTMQDESYLVNKCGDIVQQWSHTGSAGLTGRLTHDGHMLRSQYVRGCCFQASTGGLLELYDFDENIVWSHEFSTDTYTQHHDFHYMENGNILFLGWEEIDEDEQAALGKKNPSGVLWGEFIWEIKPVGTDDYELVWEWHLKDHLTQNIDSSLDNYSSIDTAIGKVDINYEGPAIFSTRDWWHVNAIHYNKERDEILMSCRSNGEIWIVDHSTTSEEAKTNFGGNRNKGGQLLFRWGNPRAYKRGSSSDIRLYGPHGHHWIDPGLPNEGKILYFNNGDGRPQGYYATVEMIEPSYDSLGNYILKDNYFYQMESHEVIYGANQSSQPLNSKYLSNAQQLPNGHILINEGNEGRIFEIDTAANIVWSMRLSGTWDNGEAFRAYNYQLDYPGFENLEFSQITETPAIDTLFGTTLCAADLRVIPTDGFIEWSNGQIEATLTVNEPGEYYYFAHSCNGDTIESERIIINEIEITPPDPQTVSVPYGEEVRIEVAGEDILWFQEESSTAPFLSNNSLFIPSATSSRTYWVAEEVDEARVASYRCYSEKVPVELIVVGTSTKDHLEDHGINLFPNPSTTEFTLKSNEDVTVDRVSVINAAGRKEQLFGSHNTYAIDHLSTGIYFIVMDTNKGQIATKLCILE